MGRNDLCVCMSGKKVKKCLDKHRIMDNSSPVALTYEIMHLVDNAINEHLESIDFEFPCKKGCTQCCNDYIEITETEFAIVMDAISELPEDVQGKIMDKAKEYTDLFKSSHIDYYNTINKVGYKTKKINLMHELLSDGKKDEFIEKAAIPSSFRVPCLFLDDGGNCLVYKNRPIICRSWGTGRRLVPNVPPFICNNISPKDSKYQADLSDCMNYFMYVHSYQVNGEVLAFKDNLPIFLWLTERRVDDNLYLLHSEVYNKNAVNEINKRV